MCRINFEFIVLRILPVSEIFVPSRERVRKKHNKTNVNSHGRRRATYREQHNAGCGVNSKMEPWLKTPWRKGI